MSAKLTAITLYPSMAGQQIRSSNITLRSLVRCMWGTQHIREAFPAMATHTAHTNICKSTNLLLKALQLSSSTWTPGAGHRLDQITQSPLATTLATGRALE